MRNTNVVVLCLLALALLLFGCGQEMPTEVNVLEKMDAATLAKNIVKYVPYRERGTLMPTTDPRADLDVECEVGEFEIFNRKDGQATHLGTIIGFENSCFNPSTGEVRVRGVNIGANGDSFSFEALCSFTSPTDFICDLTVTGGTGRFENASTPPGEPIVVVGTFDPATFTSVYTSSGRISSVGSSK